MRRADRQQDRDFSLRLIDRCGHGVLAVQTGEETPYCLPLSLVRVGESLYFHSAMEGRKIDLLRQFPRVCVTFVGGDEPEYVKDGYYTTYFQSVIVTGRAEEVTDREEKISALKALCEKLTPAAMTGDNFERAVASSLENTGVWRVEMDEITGKAKRRK